MKTNIGNVIAMVLAMAAVTAAYATDYYVDANNGNDAWDGTAAAIPDQATMGWHHPRTDRDRVSHLLHDVGDVGSVEGEECLA